MSQNANDLVVLERLMAEFFDGNTRNEKRKEIEQLLINFRNQPKSWKLCFDYLAVTKCQYSSMFCLNTIEEIINKRWVKLSWDDKNEIKNRIWLYVLHNHEKLPFCLLSKSIKLVVDIARLDWPELYPDFFPDIISLLGKSETRHLGLLYLLTTFEELIAPREDVSYDRKSELKKLLLTQMPQVLSILFEFLTNDVILSHPRDGCLILKILTNLFTWVPASQVPNDFITIIFKLASDTKNEEPSILALSTINEMLYRHWLLPHYNDIILLSLELCRSVLSSPLSQLNPIYMEKFSEFLRLVLPLHLSHRDDLESTTNTHALFSAATNFTMRQPTLIPGFTSCLSIWSHLLDYPHRKKYCGLFLTLVPQVMDKIQFRLNATNLKTLDDQILDDDGETEWKTLIKSCIEITAKVAEMEPLIVIRIVVQKWGELCNLYFQLLKNIQSQNSDSVLSLLKDLTTFTEIMGCFQIHCSGEDWDDESLLFLSKLTFEHLLTLNELGLKIHYHSLSPDMRLNLEKLHAEVLASLKSWCYWLPLLRGDDTNKTLLDEFTVRVIDGCVPYLNVNAPTVLQHCSAHVLSTVTNLVRPGNFRALDSIKCLLTNNISHLQTEDQYLIHSALVNCIILKWPSIGNEMWEQKLEDLSAYMDTLTAPFVAVPLEYNLEYKEVIISSLKMLQHIISQYKSEGIKTKTTICISFRKSAEHALALFPIYVKDNEVNEEILHFFLTVLECLQQQVGIPFTQIAVKTFLSSFTRDQVETCLASANGGGLQQLLQILDLVVQTPGLSASKVTPMAVNMCLELFEIALTETASPSVQESLFQLVHSILLHKWHYFFKARTDVDLRANEFLAMMRAVGQSFFLSNIDLFRQNLKDIEKMNSKWNLYTQDLFKTELHSHFLSALFDILITRRHSLVNEEVAMVITNLILVDMDYFFHDFLPNYLSAKEKLETFQKVSLLRNFKNDEDVPSIVQNINRLVNDLICYQLCNSNVPNGSETA